MKRLFPVVLLFCSIIFCVSCKKTQNEVFGANPDSSNATPHQSSSEEFETSAKVEEPTSHIVVESADTSSEESNPRSRHTSAEEENPKPQDKIERPAKNGFSSSTNSNLSVGSFVIQIPNYFGERIDVEENYFRYYAESGGKAAMLDIILKFDESAPVSFDTLSNNNELLLDYIKNIGYDECSIKSQQTIELSYDIKGILYQHTFSYNGLSGIGYDFVIPSTSDSSWLLLKFCFTENTDFDYSDDYKKIIYNIKHLNLIIVPEFESGFENYKYTDVYNAFRNAGFSNIECIPHEIYQNDEQSLIDKHTIDVSVGSDIIFVPGKSYRSNELVSIHYQIVKEKEKCAVSYGSTTLIGNQCATVKSALITDGFSNFELVKTTTDNCRNDGMVYDISINDKHSFSQNDLFPVDSTVTLYYYSYNLQKMPDAVYYSTNDYDTAIKGNTGIFSYKDSGKNYDIYWIIDFNKNYVYYFTEGNGNDICERLEIESGTLNDVIIITYKDYNASYGLHFKYQNSPVTLIVEDDDGFEYSYSRTDLDNALKLMSNKTIKDY